MKHKITLQEIPLDELKYLPFNPPDRLKQENLKSLYAVIEEAGEVLVPIFVAKNNGNYIVVDGHRRVEVWREMGKKTIHAIVREDYEPAVLWSLLNRATKSITMAQWMQAYRYHYPEEHIPNHIRRQIKKLEAIVGREMFERLCDQGRSPDIYSNARAVARYCDSNNDETIRKVIDWFETHHQQFLARRYISNGLPADILLNHVLNNTSLKISIT